MGTLTSYVGALDAAKSSLNGSAGFSWINIIPKDMLQPSEDIDDTRSSLSSFAQMDDVTYG